MLSIPLKIFIHGLIALVPATDPSGAKMTALLVDGRTANPNPLQCMTAHYPQLQFFAAADAQCINAGCTAQGDCNCMHDPAAGKDPLIRKQIWLEISPSPTLATGKPSSSLPGHSLPDDSREAGSFSYVANLSQEPFGLKIDPKYLAPTPPPEALSHMVARMEVPYKTVTACSLAARRDGGQDNAHAMSFRELNHPSGSGDVSYALAQMVVTELDVPDGGSVKLHISDFGGANDHSIDLAVDPAIGYYQITLSNIADDLDYDHPCNDGVARHFRHFYDFAENPPSPILLPHVRITQFKSWTPLQPNVCKDPHHALSNRPICPIATFNP
jgi:hypothetical protein